MKHSIRQRIIAPVTGLNVTKTEQVIGLGRSMSADNPLSHVLYERLRKEIGNRYKANNTDIQEIKITLQKQ